MYEHLNKLACLCTLAVAVSCSIDSRYDVENGIDGTISIGGDSLAFPVGKTDAMTIGELLRMEDNTYLKTDAQGNMYIEVVPEPLSNTFTLDPIGFKAPETSQVSMDFPAPFTPEELETVSYVSLPLEEGLDKEIESDPIDIPEMVAGLYSAGFSATGSVEVNLVSTTLSEVTLEHIEIEFPQWIIFDDSSISSGNRLVIENIPVDKSAPYIRNVSISGIDFTKMDEGYGLDPESHKLTIKGKINYTGSIRVYTDKVIGSTTEPFSLTADLYLYGKDMTEDIDIEVIDADITYGSEQISEEFSLELPEELSGENTVLDLQGAMLLMDIDNGSPLPVSASGRIAARDKDGKDISSASFMLPEIAADGKTSYAVSENGDSHPGYAPVAAPGFDGLLYRLPSSIGINAEVESDKVRAVFRTGVGYDFNIACRFYAPLVFGDDVHFEYPYLIEGLSSSLKGTGIKALMLNAVAESTFPIGLGLEAEVLDASGIKVDGISVTFGDSGTGISIPAPDNGEASVCPVSIRIAAGDDEVLAVIDKISIKAIASGSNGRNVREDDYLLLRDISITIPGGITTDLSNTNNDQTK